MPQFFVVQYAAEWVSYVVAVLLVVTSLIGLYCDLRWREIPNWLTYGAMALGLLFNGVLAGSNGLISSFAGLVIASILFLPLFYMGGFGGGDVKLMAGLGALSGAGLAVNILLLTAVSGGLLGLVQVTCRKSWGTTWKRLGLLFRFKTKELEAAPEAEQLTMPYGIAMALGTILTVVLSFTDRLIF